MSTLAPTNQVWTDAEMKEISRLHEACKVIHYCCRLECSHSEEADPWCVLYDPRDHSIILHIARIDRRYVVVFGSERPPQRMATVAGAVDTALKRLFAREKI
jgi:hypothetical protein